MWKFIDVLYLLRLVYTYFLLLYDYIGVASRLTRTIHGEEQLNVLLLNSIYFSDVVTLMNKVLFDQNIMRRVYNVIIVKEKSSVSWVKQSENDSKIVVVFMNCS